MISLIISSIIRGNVIRKDCSCLRNERYANKGTRKHFYAFSDIFEFKITDDRNFFTNYTLQCISFLVNVQLKRKFLKKYYFHMDKEINNEK